MPCASPDICTSEVEGFHATAHLGVASCARGGGVCWNPLPQDAPSISELTPAPCMTAPHLAPVYTSAKSSTAHRAYYGNCPLLVCAPCNSSLAVSKYLLVGVHTFGITFSGIKRGLASWLEAFWHLLQKVSARAWR